MSSMRRVISLGFTFLLATPVISALPTGDGWQEMETENFIVFSNLDDSATKEIGLDLDGCRPCWRKSSRGQNSTRLWTL